MTIDAKRYTLPRVPSSEPDPVHAISWSDAKLSPNADITEALTRAQQPRRLWPLLHAVEGTAERPPGWWESWPALWLFMLVLVVIAGAMLAKC